MAFTRFHDDRARIEKELQQSTGSCRYILNTPGTGDSPHFMEDPFIRMDKWGANLRTNFVDIQSDLRGLTRSLRRDTQTYDEFIAPSNGKKYPTQQPVTDQSRATNPAWTTKGLDTNRWDFPHKDPQANIEIPFTTYTSTRLEQKNQLWGVK